MSELQHGISGTDESVDEVLQIGLVLERMQRQSAYQPHGDVYSII
jgi:hypothetical protein